MTIANRTLPDLPLLLWKTPPALRGLLEQEGVAFRDVGDAHPLAFRSGRFVLFDGRRHPRSELRSLLKPEHVAIDVDLLRDRDGDPFATLLDTTARETTWRLQHQSVTERVSRVDRSRLRAKILGRLRDVVTQAGGLWARLAPYPYPYRSAFNLRVDLDEDVPADYFAFAEARRPIDDATTHFVSTRAYGDRPEVLADLRRLDTHSHGHHHVVYREAEANRVNLRRAADILDVAGIEGRGFAGPHGRWNARLDEVMEEAGVAFSSEFGVGYDDLPFFAWTGQRPSRVLQIPVHPICEGLFFDAGADGPEPVIAHLTSVIRAKIDAGEPAFVYGHPERRLGRFPEIVTAIADAISDEPLTWRVDLSTFARWWRWRLARDWSIVPKGERGYEVQVDEWDAAYPLGLEVVRGRHAATIPLQGPVTPLDPSDLAYTRTPPGYALPDPLPFRRERGWRSAVRRALDWETVTPIEDLPNLSVRSRLKREIRVWRERSRRAG